MRSSCRGWPGWEAVSSFVRVLVVFSGLFGAGLLSSPSSRSSRRESRSLFLGRAGPASEPSYLTFFLLIVPHFELSFDVGVFFFLRREFILHYFELLLDRLQNDLLSCLHGLLELLEARLHCLNELDLLRSEFRM